MSEPQDPADRVADPRRPARLAVVPQSATHPAGRAGLEVDLLECGRPVEALVDQADAGRLEPVDPHQAGCRFCRQALQDAATSSRALDLLRTSRTHLPVGLVDKVLRAVRHRQPAPARLALPASASGVPGQIRVSQQLLATVARLAAASQPGVTVTRAATAALPVSRSPVSSPAGTRLAEVAGGLQVSLAVLVDGSTPLPELAAAIRQSVRAALAWAVGAVDVQIELAALDLVPGGDG